VVANSQPGHLLSLVTDCCTAAPGTAWRDRLQPAPPRYSEL